tara:strand:+ start:345 stop:656 length:312 start_codon:yes stop_codon:yes gene_type:complete
MKNNKLIAEFMGYNYDKCIASTEKSTPLDMQGEYLTPDGDSVSESELEFHESWDWLMPVLKKIKLQIHPNNMGMWRKVTQPIGYDIHEVHQEAVEFIKRYSNE